MAATTSPAAVQGTHWFSFVSLFCFLNSYGYSMAKWKTPPCTHWAQQVHTWHTRYTLGIPGTHWAHQVHTGHTPLAH